MDSITMGCRRNSGLSDFQNNMQAQSALCTAVKTFRCLAVSKSKTGSLPERDRQSPRGRQEFYQREPGSLAEEEQAVYQRETGSLPVRDGESPRGRTSSPQD